MYTCLSFLAHVHGFLVHIYMFLVFVNLLSLFCLSIPILSPSCYSPICLHSCLHPSMFLSLFLSCSYLILSLSPSFSLLILSSFPSTILLLPSSTSPLLSQPSFSSLLSTLPNLLLLPNFLFPQTTPLPLPLIPPPSVLQTTNPGKSLFSSNVDYHKLEKFLSSKVLAIMVLFSEEGDFCERAESFSRPFRPLSAVYKAKSKQSPSVAQSTVSSSFILCS